MENVNIVDAILSGDQESFAQAFNAALADKVNDALEIKKIELASTLITPQEEPSYEVEGSAEQSDGSGE